jgi:hypothetical protein
MLANFIHRYIDPTDSLGETLFGLIMALTITLGARLLSQATEFDPRELVVAMIGCNVAWGVIDAVLYLIGSVFSRNRRVQFVRKLRAATNDVEAMAAIREEFGLEDEPVLSDADREAFHRLVLDIMRHAGTERAHLRLQDYQAALVIALVVSLTAVPGVLPFLFIADGHLALVVANTIQICLLFFVGYRWASHTGSSPWRTGLLILALGIGLVVVAVALGG